jgi:phosphocarrier protein
MIEKTFTVLNRQGLHARPAAVLVRTAHRFESELRLRKDGQEVDGKSIMGILTLTAECGSRVTVTAEGPDEKEAIKSLEEFFSKETEDD